MITFFIISISALAIRLLIVKLHSHHFNGLIEVGDAAGHMVFIRQLRKKFNSRKIEKYLVQDFGEISYPFLFHRLASFLPNILIEKKRYFFNSFLFFLNILFINLLNSLYISDYDINKVILFNVIFIFSISNNVFFGTNISYLDIGERYFSRSLVSYYYYFTYWLICEVNFLISVIFLTIITAFALSSSKFSRQAIILPSIILFFFDYKLLIPFLFGILLILILDYRKFVYSLKHQIIFSYFYKKVLSKSVFASVGLTRMINLKDVLSFLKLPNKKTLLNLAIREPLRTLIFLPEIPIIIFAIFVLNGYEDVFFKIFGSVFLIYVITNLKSLNFLGESYRYLEYSFYFILPVILSKITWTNQFQSLIIFLLAYNGIIILIYYLVINKPRKNSFIYDFKEIVQKNFFNSESRILTMPLRLSHGLILNTDASAMWWQPTTTNSFIWDKIIEQYPYPSKDLNFLINRYNITHLVFDYRNEKNIPWVYNFDNYSLIFKNNTFKVFETKKLTLNK